jgi:hypothetical protein
MYFPSGKEETVREPKGQGFNLGRGPPKGYIDAMESKSPREATMLTADRIGRIENILFTLVEQQKAGPSASPAMLNEIVQGVKQLQNMASGSELEASPESTEFRMGQVGYNAGHDFNPPQSAPSAPREGRPSSVSRRYTSPARPPRTNFAMDQPVISREHQRRRIHPPSQRYSPAGPDLDPDDDNTVTDDQEMAQITGQLSLDENNTVRYHGSSSGLTLLTRSKRFDGTFWNLPNPGSYLIRVVADFRFLASFR